MELAVDATGGSGSLARSGRRLGATVQRGRMATPAAVALRGQLRLERTAAEATAQGELSTAAAALHVGSGGPVGAARSQRTASGTAV